MLDLLRSGSLKNSLRFDYGQIAADVRDEVIGAALDIRQRIGRAQGDLIATGQRLTETKALLPHGQFQDWVEIEFGFSQRTAQNLMNVAERFAGKSETVSLFSDSTLYLLAAPSTPEPAVEAAAQEARATGKLTKERTKAIIAEHRPPTVATANQERKQAEEAALDREIFRLSRWLIARGWGIVYSPMPNQCYVVKENIRLSFAHRDDKKGEVSALQSAKAHEEAGLLCQPLAPTPEPSPVAVLSSDTLAISKEAQALINGTTWERVFQAQIIVRSIDAMLSHMGAYGQLTGKHLHIPPAERSLKMMQDELQSLINALKGITYEQDES